MLMSEKKLKEWQESLDADEYCIQKKKERLEKKEVELNQKEKDCNYKLKELEEWNSPLELKKKLDEKERKLLERERHLEDTARTLSTKESFIQQKDNELSKLAQRWETPKKMKEHYQKLKKEWFSERNEKIIKILRGKNTKLKEQIDELRVERNELKKQIRSYNKQQRSKK
jgi:chromosome segregation ATPase